MEVVVQFPDQVLIPVCPPCCSPLVHIQGRLHLCHAQDCPHPSPNHLSLTLPLQYLYQSQGSMGNWVLVWCFAFAWHVEAWDLTGKDGRASMLLCWLASNSFGDGHPLACLHCVSLSHPNASSPLEACVGLWTQH